MKQLSRVLLQLSFFKLIFTEYCVANGTKGQSANVPITVRATTKAYSTETRSALVIPTVSEGSMLQEKPSPPKSLSCYQLGRQRHQRLNGR